MARLHILEAGGGTNVYTCVAHAPTPAGPNAAGVAWSVAIQNSGRAVTGMTVGNGPGQITNVEANQIAAGTVIEASFPWEDDPDWTLAQRTADQSTRAAQAVTELTANLQRILKFYGQIVT